MGYRVDTVPWPVRPLYLAVTWTLGLIFYLYYVICRLTSRISIEGLGSHDLPQHAVWVTRENFDEAGAHIVEALASYGTYGIVCGPRGRTQSVASRPARSRASDTAAPTSSTG
jgi:hypothetical protein